MNPLDNPQTEWWLEIYAPGTTAIDVARHLEVELRVEGLSHAEPFYFPRLEILNHAYWMLESGNDVWAQDGAAHGKPGYVRFWCRDETPACARIAERWERAAKQFKEDQ